VACQFGVMFFPDRIQGYREARRVLKPGGHFFFNVWDQISESEFAHVVAQALAADVKARGGEKGELFLRQW
jgi:ubiquinone/menaquinone biosynthesis C-methylase UbiE